jgi:hypothetical protein
MSSADETGANRVARHKEGQKQIVGLHGMRFALTILFTVVVAWAISIVSASAQSLQEWQKQLPFASVATLRQVYLNKDVIIDGHLVDWEPVAKDPTQEFDSPLPKGYTSTYQRYECCVKRHGTVIDVLSSSISVYIIVLLDDGVTVFRAFFRYGTSTGLSSIPNSVTLVSPITADAARLLDRDAAAAVAAERKARQTSKEQQEARKLETQRRIAACHELYQRTSNKKVSDLTVTEEQQVRACQVLGYYR